LIGSDPLFVLKLDHRAASVPPCSASRFSGLSSHLCLTKRVPSRRRDGVIRADFFRLPLIALIGWLFTPDARPDGVRAAPALISSVRRWLWNLRAAAREPST